MMNSLSPLELFLCANKSRKNWNLKKKKKFLQIFKEMSEDKSLKMT